MSIDAQLVPFYMVSALSGGFAALEADRRILGRYRQRIATAGIWAAFVLSCYLHIHHGSSIHFDPAAPDQTDWSPMATIAVDSALATTGFKVACVGIYRNLSHHLRQSLVQWVTGILFTVTTGIIAYAVSTSAQNDADDIIRSITHVAPERLPGAQRMVTLLLSIQGWLISLFVVYYVVVLAVFAFITSPRVRFRHTQWFEDLFHVTRGILILVSMLAVLYYGIPAITAPFREAQIIKGAFWARVIIGSSFTSNRPSNVENLHGGIDDPHSLICRNLSASTLIAFVTPNDPVSTKALIADIQQATINFRLVVCDNSSNPYHLE